MIPFKSAFVVGALPSGLYAALFLHERDIRVFVSEFKPENAEEKFSEARSKLTEAHIPFEFGRNSLELLRDYDVLIVSPGVPPEAPIILEARRTDKPVIGETEIAVYGGLSVLAVTGSNGKSTTTALLGDIIRQQYAADTVIGGNLGTPVSQLLVEHPSAKIAVLEVSCFQLETIHDFHPHVAIFSNLVPNHLDRYHTMDRYFATKQRLFENMDKNDIAILNWDDSALKELGPKLASQVYYFGFGKESFPGAHLSGDSIVYSDGAHEVELLRTSDLTILGRHNIANAMSAALAAYLYGVSLDRIRLGARGFKGLPHRLEFVAKNNGISFINDSKATTPESVMIASDAMQERYVVILGGSSKDVSFGPMANHLAADSRLVSAVVMGTTGPSIEQALRAAGFTAIERADSLEEAIDKSIRRLGSSGTVLLSPACASFDMFRDFEQRGDRFKEIVKNRIGSQNS